MDNKIDRDIGNPVVTFASGATVSSAIDIQRFAFGNLQLPVEFSGDTITFQGCDTESGTYQLIHSKDGTSAYSYTAVTNIWKELDGCVFAMPFIKVVTSVATAGAATGRLCLKT